ncbi:MAG: amidohydrolase [Bacteroidetes bacterium]|nr:MAG: amidohydrolase [Bacteroidota bacterium]
MKSYQYLLVFLLFISCTNESSNQEQTAITNPGSGNMIREINHKELPIGAKTIAIVGATLIDGTGKPPLYNATVVIKGNSILEVGPSGSLSIPKEAEIVDGKGLTLLPGLIDAHFHLNNNELPNLVLQRGITSVRDPGAWIESYSAVRDSDITPPRLFLTGPHLDMPPPAYPKNSYLIRDPIEARYAVNKFADQGASAIKIYIRLPVAIIKEVCATAHQRGIPVTAHLEITSAMEAIAAGVDGIEHVTSFGTDLLPTFEAQQYEQSVLEDNSARREGRYQVWNAIDIEGDKVDSLLLFLKQHKTVVSPTLGAFEYRFGEDKTDSIKVRAFENMMIFIGKAHKAGIPTVVGSHSSVPYAERGWAYQREMELLSESGLTNMEIIVAATMENARFFKVEDRLGSVEEGKQADLLLLEGDPIKKLDAFYSISRVMLNGVWVSN